MEGQLSIFHLRSARVSVIANQTVGRRPPEKNRASGSTAEPLSEKYK